MLKQLIRELTHARDEDDDDPGRPTGSGRTILFHGDVTDEMVKHTLARMIYLAEDHAQKPITLVLNTSGGELYEAMALYDMVRYLGKGGVHVRTVGIGKIMSAGCLLLASGEKGHRKIGANAALMYHAAWSSSHGNMWEQEVGVAELKRQQRQYDELVARETGRSISEIQALYVEDRVDKYLTPDQAKALGFVDEVF